MSAVSTKFFVVIRISVVSWLWIVGEPLKLKLFSQKDLGSPRERCLLKSASCVRSSGDGIWLRTGKKLIGVRLMVLDIRRIVLLSWLCTSLVWALLRYTEAQYSAAVYANHSAFYKRVFYPVWLQGIWDFYYASTVSFQSIF